MRNRLYTTGEYLRRNGIVHLQGVGKVRAKPAEDFNIGDKMGWNYGYTSEVVGRKHTKSGKSINFLLKSTRDGKVRKRLLRADRLVAIAR